MLKAVLWNLGSTAVPLNKAGHIWTCMTDKGKGKKSSVLRAFICASPPDCLKRTQLWVLFNAMQHQIKCICTALYLVLFILTKLVVCYMYPHNTPTFMMRVVGSVVWFCVHNLLALPFTGKRWHSFIFCLWSVWAVKQTALSLQMYSS